MSHTTTIAVRIRDLDCLEKAAERCGITLVRNAQSFRFYSRSTEPCDHLLRLNDEAYEIGLIKTPGTEDYSLSFDAYSGGYGMMSKVGNDCNKLIQMYALEVAKKEAQVYVNDGWTVAEVALEDGSIQLQITQGVAGW